MTITSAWLSDTSIEQIEAEHQVQLRLLRAFQDAAALPEAHFNAAVALEQFRAFTDAHFMSEQLLMRLYAYPESGAHQAEHDHILAMLAELERHWAAGDTAPLQAQAELLHATFIEHMQRSDPAFKAFLRDVQPE
jgi:hemerythrin